MTHANDANDALDWLAPWRQFAERIGMVWSTAPAAATAPAAWPEGLAPLLGYWREYQSIHARMAMLTLRFQGLYGELMAQGATVMHAAAQSLQCAPTEVQPNAAAAERYDAWIEAAETAYSQVAHADTYARLLGDLCNTLSAFNIERGKLLERICRQLDLPSRAEVDSLHAQVQALRGAQRAAASATPPAPGRASPAARGAAPVAKRATSAQGRAAPARKSAAPQPERAAPVRKKRPPQ